MMVTFGVYFSICCVISLLTTAVAASEQAVSVNKPIKTVKSWHFSSDLTMKFEEVQLLGILLIAQTVYSLPQFEIDDLSPAGNNRNNMEGNPEVADKEGVPFVPKIYEMKVDANVTNRFVKCLVTSKVRNLDKSAREATFSVVIPEQAYITGFTMEIDGKQYEAYVQEKEKAKTTYEKAVQSGQSAAHVAVSARDSNRFTVSLNIEPQKKATFYLKYEELLRRSNNQYELVINIHPGQPVKNLDVEVHIDESSSIRFVKIPPLRSGNEIAKNDQKLNTNADIKKINESSVVVKFSPDLEKQKQYATDLGTNADNGFAGQFIVQYDVEKVAPGGQVLVDGGHFVHFFSPDDLTPLPKQIIFILDTSGSMGGIRITQLKEAMRSILPELKKGDKFSIIEFGSIVKVWNIDKVAVQYQSGTDYYWVPEDPEAIFKNRTQQPIPPPYPATEEFIEKAENVVDKLTAFGGTDIQSALRIGLEIMPKNGKDLTHAPMIVFLTDGEATEGEIVNERIISFITELNSGRSPIFSLSFGDGADRNFLEKISVKNLGFNRHIYEAADASLQLQEFYKQISSPLLSNVTFKYVNNVTEVTKQIFPLLFSGSELVVSGQIIDPGFSPSIVHGWGVDGPIKLQPVVNRAIGSLERLWAYLTLKQYLKQREISDDKSGTTQEALRIALKYSFVSDVTSLVVVKPNETDAVETEDASTDKGYPMFAKGITLHRSSLSINGHLHRPRYPLTNGGPHHRPAPAFNILPSNAPTWIPISTTPLISTSTIYTPSKTESPLDYLKNRLPWLAKILNKDETINLKAGKFSLGLNETVTDIPPCPLTPLNQPGECTLIYRCSEIFDQLTDLGIYEKHFCDFQGHAGVCCPKHS